MAAGFQVGVATAWRYIREAIILLAATANDLHQAMTRIRLPTLVMSCRACTRHTYDGTRRDGRMT